ncbi:MAG: AAA family ATPase [Bacteroidales bacterium]|nr:AAA family ATPase [Bacteroidales bacterium]
METGTRKYPVGIQTFSVIRKGGYLYIDKTDLVWEMTRMKFVFLSRPRRFGKSLLTSTLDAYFKGDKALFEGLKIMALEKDWESYPVFHLDLSSTKAETTVEGLRTVLFRLLEGYKQKYGEGAYETSPGGLFSGLIHRAFEQTGRQVVVIIDEYDAPLLDKLHQEELLGDFRNVMQEFFVQLKSNESMIRFCFITGITKFSQLSIFSTINNLTNISMQKEYSALCGITEEEFTRDMDPDIEMLSQRYECTKEEMHERLKQQYDGYHFSEESPEVYNPFSLLKCFLQKKIANYWFESGTPSYLIRQMQHFRTDITSMDRIEADAMSFDRPTEAMEDALPLLYQSGYLTIKDYDSLLDFYTLAIPNKEVRVGLLEGLIPTYIGMESGNVKLGFAAKFWKVLRTGDIHTAMQEMKAFLASVPYVEGFRKKLSEVKNYEGFYEYTFWLIFNMLNVYAPTQVKCAGGRIDFVVNMPDTTYVFELKVHGSAKAALEQINSQGYALPFQTEGRSVVKVGVSFDRDTMTVGDWVVE